MKKYLFAMMIANAALFACTDLEEDDSLATWICYDDEEICYEDVISEDESDSGDHPDNQDNELIAWM